MEPNRSQANVDKDINLDIDEMRTALATMSLTSITVGEYLVVMSADFDVVLHGEPYLALTLLLNTRSGQFLARIWDRTVRLGRADGTERFVGACREHFCRGKPCLGWPRDHGGGGEQYLTLQTPVPRVAIQ